MAELKGPARIDKAKGMRERRLAGSLAMNQFQKSLSENATRVSKDREELQKMKRQAFDSNDQAERIANIKKTGGKSIDKQILEQITERGRELAKSQIAAYGPDGNAEMIAQYNIDKAQINKDLDDLTMFVGTLDAEIEARDKAIDDGTFIQQVNENGQKIAVEDDEQFKNGIFNGMSDIELTYDADGGGYSINPTAQHIANTMVGATPADISPINLGVYAENLRKNGTSYKTVSPNAQPAMVAVGSGIIDGLAGQTEITFSKMEGEIDNPKYDAAAQAGKKPGDDGYEPEMLPVKKGYKTQDLDKMRKALGTKLFSQAGMDLGLTNAKGQPIKLPPENQMWEQLKREGFVDDYVNRKGAVLGYLVPDPSNPGSNTRKSVDNNVSWDSWGKDEADKQAILKDIYLDYLMETQFPTTDPTGKTITTGQTVTGSKNTGRWNNATK